MTGLTVPAFALVALAFWRPSWWPMCLAVAGMAPAGVALIAGGIGFPGFYFVALFAAMGIALRWAGIAGMPLRAAGVPGMRPLIAFGVWATVVTISAPALFPALPVLGSSPDNQTMLIPGVVTASNIAQVTYLWIAIAAIVLVASAPKAYPHLVGVTAFGIVGLSFWKYVSDLAGLPFPMHLFDNNPSWIYIETAPGGAERFRGILSEPASLANFCLAAAAFAVAMLPRATARMRVGLLAVVGVSTWLGIESTSTTFVVAGSLLCVLALCVFAGSMLRSRGTISATHVVTVLVLLIAVYVAGAGLVHYVSDEVLAKSGSDSYTQRSGVDAFSWQVAFRSLGVGVGLGANRPSSFALMLLSNVGVVGTVLFVVAVVQIVRHALRCGGAGPALWVFAAVLTAKLVSGPDLADTSGLFFMSLGALAGLRPPGREPSARHPGAHRSTELRLSHA